MEPLIALVGVTVGVIVVNKSWIRRPRGVETALRAGVAAMFTLTGIAHFVSMRAELIAMVPKWLPLPDLIVTVTGILELGAAAAMYHRRLATVAAAGLTLLLIAMFPANVALALSGTPLPWWDELVPRTIMQVLFVTATVTVFLLTLRPADHAWKNDLTPAESRV
ncbi:DoxX family protein [Streptomyces sp. Tue6028]|uniref:DoxX family protein n=1 Tax=Streptomyces sp. Tue6028 TaxID=2036037 RepID=UPI003EC0ACBD